MQTVSLLVHRTDRTVPAVWLCCVQRFVVSGEVLTFYTDMLLVDVITILIILHYCYGRTK
jgi:hypothetical protein